MKNKYLLILLASLFTGVANAGDLDLSGVGVSIGTVHSKTAMGYKYQLNNGWTLKPKVGYTYFKSIYDDGSNYGNGYNAGLELGVNKNVSIDFNYHHLNGKESGHYVNLMSLGVKYTF